MRHLCNLVFSRSPFFPSSLFKQERRQADKRLNGRPRKSRFTFYTSNKYFYKLRNLISFGIRDSTSITMITVQANIVHTWLTTEEGFVEIPSTFFSCSSQILCSGKTLQIGAGVCSMQQQQQFPRLSALERNSALVCSANISKWIERDPSFTKNYLAQGIGTKKSLKS